MHVWVKGGKPDSGLCLSDALRTEVQSFPLSVSHSVEPAAKPLT